MKKVILLMTFLLCPGLSQASTDIFFEIDGVVGDSIDPDHFGAMELEAWSWGTERQNAKRLCIEDVSVTKYTDRSSPILLMNQVEGVVYPTATLTVRRDGFEYVVLEFRNIQISTLGTGGSNDGDQLIENITFDFKDVEYTYITEDENGDPEEEISAIIRSRKCKN